MQLFSVRSIVITVLAASGSVEAVAAPSASKFLESAMQDGMAEVASCQLAMQQAVDPKVKSFAERMIKDHTDADAKISALAKSKNIKLPKHVTIKQKATYELLRTRSGASFDQQFMKHNVADHEQDIKDFSEQADQASDPDVKAFAVATLKTLEQHLALSKEVSAAVGNSDK